MKKRRCIVYYDTPSANGLVLMERLQGLTATDVTHSCDQRRLSLYSIYDLKNTVKIHLLNNKT